MVTALPRTRELGGEDGSSNPAQVRNVKLLLGKVTIVGELHDGGLVSPIGLPD